ncbi:WXG100 family type VII secretion target [Streptomyces sp. SMS_SU21]|uniref:WXG100 family type VII secretion target n=1 Tax=Streptomyces sp. SMS_SU21 TaxID=2069440 RepID=UPI0011B521C1|nr:WXG100 family type VII secretion target [Streptomyces sp. SMS_SU21]MCA2200909.1 hypothetical protein [Streptomyces sp. SMS_SU21]
MSGHEKKPDPFLEERQEARQQNGVLDAVTDMTRLSVPFGPFHHRGIHFGSTNFEGYDLNDMVDIVESANPELLESAAEALVQARDAIRTAAEELQKDIGGVDWKGESNTAFTTWADSLVKTAEGIADYADVVGTQVLAASSGLASVRKSMPPRDTRTDRKTVDDIPAVAQVDGNADYTAALKAEKNRQEAINQMYRLASYYTVSADTMQSAEEPVFPKMPDVGVPGPAIADGPGPRDGGLQPPTALADARASSEELRFASSERPRAEQPPLLASGAHPEVPPKHHVGTEINSVGTLPPQEVMKPATTPPVTNVSAGQQAGPPSLGPGAGPLASPPGAGRATRPGGTPVSSTPPSAQGRATGATGSGSAARTGPAPLGQGARGATPGPVGGRTTGPVGPMAQTGRGVLPGQAGVHGPGPAARGVSGGVPKPVGPVPGHLGGAPRDPASAPGAVRSGRGAPGSSGDGVVGGRPVTGATPVHSSPRLPRGTVIGGGGVPGASPTGQGMGQRGVIGAPPPVPTRSQAARRPTAGSDGGVSAPGGRASGAQGNGGRRDAAAQRGVVESRNAAANRSRRDERRRDASATD